MRTIAQNKRIFMLLNQLHIDEQLRHDMCMLRYNRAGVHELEESEAQDFINYLSEMLSKAQTQANELAQKMRRTVMKLGYDIGLLNATMTNDEKVVQINSWIARKTKFAKQLNNLSIEDLQLLIRQLQTVRRIKTDKEQRLINLN